jgi:hypothetical protein
MRIEFVPENDVHRRPMIEMRVPVPENEHVNWWNALLLAGTI